MPKKRMYADLDGVPYEERLAKGLIHHNFKDITGQRFGKLVAEAPLYSSNGHWRWRFRCDCGGIDIRSTQDIVKSAQRGCQIMCPTCRKNRTAYSRTHGMSKRPIYAVWHSMKLRCFCKTYPAYPRYGGRGITVCDRWKDSFENFLEDMGPTYQRGLVLDRINTNGNYCPENCRWTTYKVNARNSANVYAEIDIIELSKATGVARSTILYRIHHGWPLEMLGIPANRGNTKLKAYKAQRKYIKKYSTSEIAGQDIGSSLPEQKDR